MQTVRVSNEQGQYEIHIKNGLVQELAYYASKWLKGQKVVLITDKNVWRHHGDMLRGVFADTPYTVHRLLIKPGEDSKHIKNVTSLYQALVRLEVTRNDLIIALGGGVVGDFVGFVAATYLRGVPLIQVPTTLLAMVDSSVGGKVAVNLDEGKNLVGAFYQPQAVLIDPDLLRTLPSREFKSGMAEVLKYGCIMDPDLFSGAANLYQAQNIYVNVLPLIRRCCEIKADIVSRDFLERGERMLLNFGHTIGHALEKATNYGTLTHGEAVAIGMAVITRIAEEMGWSPSGITGQIAGALMNMDLPLEPPVEMDKILLQAIRHDKKRHGDQLHIITLDAIGQARIRIVPIDAFETKLSIGGKP